MLVYPLRIIWVESKMAEQVLVRAAFSVSRRIFRNATDRNLLKRRMKEAYRVNRNIFYDNDSAKNINLMCIFIAHEMKSYSEIEKAIQTGLKKMIRQSAGDKQ